MTWQGPLDEQAAWARDAVEEEKEKEWVIWKESIPRNAQEFTLNLPKGARLLTIQRQHNQMCLWFECDPRREEEVREFVFYGTGWDIPDRERLTYIDTFQTVSKGKTLAWHLFERREDEQLRYMRRSLEELREITDDPIVRTVCTDLLNALTEYRSNMYGKLEPGPVPIQEKS